MTRPLSVLVVDDAAAIRLLCRVNLELDGHRVLEAATVNDARDTLAQEDVSLVVLDVHVGPADGLELLDEIRREHPDVAVVLLTGSTELEGVRAHGPDAVLGKPFELEELRRVVEEASDRTARSV
jgi:two-component system nitrogen regulation response regulator NtrX